MPTPLTPLAWLMALLDELGSAPLAKSPRQCPAHRDAAPSLSLHERNGVVYLFCFAGCEWRTVLRSLGCSGKVLHQAPVSSPAQWAAMLASMGTAPRFPALEITGGHPSTSGFRLEAVHDYGGWLLERWRHPVTRTKDLRWHTKDVSGATMPGLRGTPMHELPLYHEREAVQAMAAGEPVIVVESESSADALRGWAAVTWAGSANAVPVATLERVLGKYDRLVYVPDMDDAGLRCAAGLESVLGPAYLFGRLGEDARDVYARLGAKAFRAAVEGVLSEDPPRRRAA